MRILTVWSATIGGELSFRAEDCTGARWFERRDRTEVLIYTISPIYGKPGIYRFDPKSLEVICLVAPTTKNDRWPDGTDSFAILGLRGSRLRYRHISDASGSTERPAFKQGVYELELD